MNEEIDLTDLEAGIERLKQSPEFQNMLKFEERMSQIMRDWAASIVKIFSTPEWQEIFQALAEMERDPGIGSDSVMALGMEEE